MRGLLDMHRNLILGAKWFVCLMATYTYGTLPDLLERFAELVRADERAACAKLLDDFSNTQMIPVKDTWRSGVRMAANTIRDKK